MFSSNHNDEVVLYLHRTAFSEARRINLCEDDAHDCAMDMVLHVLTQATAEVHWEEQTGATTSGCVITRPAPVSVNVACLVLRADLSPNQTARWLRRCARNFALNYRRHDDVRNRYEVCWGTDCQSDRNENTLSLPSAPPAEYDAMNRLLHQDVLAAIQELTPSAREVFARFHIDGDSLAEIAFSSGKSQNAVKKQIHRLRGHVRTALTQQGHSPQ